MLHVSVQYVNVNRLSYSAGGPTGQECTGTTDTAPSFLLIRVQLLLGEHHTSEKYRSLQVPVTEYLEKLAK